MSLIYRFHSLKALADYIDNKAREVRDGADTPPSYIRGKRKAAAYVHDERVRAYEMQSLADLLRNTELGEP